MSQKIVNPIQSYLTWLRTIPVPHAQYIAYMFWFCTTENTSDMAMDHDESLIRFKNYLIREDFPLRVLTRMLVVRDVTNLIVKNNDLFTSGQAVSNLSFDKEEDKVVFLSGKQWEKTLSSWQELYYGHLSDNVFSVWVRSVTADSRS